MKRRAVHYQPGPVGKGGPVFCKQPIVRPIVTSVRSMVTCKNCLIALDYDDYVNQVADYNSPGDV